MSAWDAQPKSIGFSIIGVTKPTDVQIQAAAESECKYEYADKKMTLEIICKSIENGLIVTAKGVTPSFVI